MTVSSAGPISSSYCRALQDDENTSPTCSQWTHWLKAIILNQRGNLLGKAQLFTNWMVFPEKACKKEENSKAVSGLIGLQSVCTDQESEVPDLASHLHCKHNEQTVSRSALNPGLTGVWRVCWALSRVWGAEHLQGHRAIFVCAYLSCQHKPECDTEDLSSM